jgi:hypothetical protein
METTKIEKTVEIVDGNYLFTTVQIVKMDLNEAFNSYKQIDTALAQNKQRMEALEKDIKEESWKTLQRELLQNKELFEDFKLKCETVLKPKLDDMVEKVKQKVAVLKAEKGYLRVSDKIERSNMKANILAEAITPMEINDIFHPVYREVLENFDK